MGNCVGKRKKSKSGSSATTQPPPLSEVLEGLTPLEIQDEYSINPDAFMNATAQDILPSEILEGIGVIGADELFRIINELPFDYTGGSFGSGVPGMGFLSKQGDCKMLRDMYLYAAEYLGIDARPVDKAGRHIVGSAKIHGRTTTGNTAGNTHWYFDTHHWVTVNGQVYDLLFKTKSLATAYDQTDEKTYREVRYMVFSNGLCMVPPSRSLDGEINDSEGLVVQSETEAKNYIEKHKV